ncbi:uncharacterized protein LOC123560253 [Mercenaria mercenaria]|uniref:uncharacterized protein LOC123560253 n=1 Tax=Mercenaria mercenaria TaxID=6596 RepID=UPI001E1D65A9|nr:uncharacterized protein LOC123560253 [Mercenaria mercenaria]
MALVRVSIRVMYLRIVRSRVEAERACEQFGERVLVNLEERFADVGDSKILRGYCGIFDPSVFVREGEVLEECIRTVSQHLGEEDFREEYMRFRGEVTECFARVANDVNSVCQLALRKRDMYECVADAAYRLLCIPVSSVECERGFSVQNLIKTKLRNRLDTRSLYLLMKLQTDGGPKYSFDFAAAYGKWKNMKSRRICGY